MPATAGRVRMPHNNRMSTSATLKTHAIWQTAIGHDPYANEAEQKENTRDEKADQEKLEKVMGMARSQNVTDGAQRNDFTARMYSGLKRGKQRRGDAQAASDSVDPKVTGLLEEPSSSSEDEFVEIEAKKTEKKKKPKSKDSKRKRYSSSSDDSSSDESSERYERKRRREKRRKRKRKSHRKSHDSDDSSSNSNHRRRRRERHSRKDDRTRSRRDHKGSRKEES
eukprot:scaffold1669_cov129-Cylindrotheca_fusiformis.AAC.39